MSEAALHVVGAALDIPDPRKQPVPPGWFERVAAPAILEATDWDWLDEHEARLKALASYVESFDGDSVEFEKALRVIEKRRGDLLGSHGPGRPNSPRPENYSDASEGTKNRWRSIARHWEVLWPIVREATKRGEVSQSALLRRVEMGVHYSSERDDWTTPQDLFDKLNAEFNFTLDVCATDASAKCASWFTKEQDGLAQPWTGSCWMNPPYGDEIGRWIGKAWNASKGSATVVCLVPARVDTAWWWNYCRHGDVRFLRGRLRFGGGETGAPFPSAVVVFPGNGRTLYWERG